MSDLRWTRELVGIPELDRGRSTAGADCWGLIVLAYRLRLGVELPGYEADYPTSAELREIDATVRREAQSPLWQTVDEPASMDVLFFRLGRYDHHAALWLEPGLMLHMARGDCSKIERFDRSPWASRLTGMYRWRGAQ